MRLAFPRRGPALAILALGCRSPAPTPSHDTAPPTADTHTPSSWTARIPDSQGFGDTLAILSVQPLLAVVGWKGVVIYPAFNEGSASVVALDLDAEVATRITTVSRYEPMIGTLPVAAPGDVTGDGHADAFAGLWPARLFHGPFELGMEPSSTDLDHADYGRPTSATPCDAGADGQPDLCTSHGIYRAPVTGAPPAAWWGFGSTVGVVRGTDGPALLIDSGARFVRVPLDAVGEVDLQVLPGWSKPEGFSSQATDLVDRGDGTDDILTCGREQNDPESHALWRVGEPSWERLIELSGPCLALEVADFDGDSSPEVAVGLRSQVLIVEPGSWTVAATWVGDEGHGAFEFGAALAAADLDGDGRMDLLVGAPQTGGEDSLPGYVYVSTAVMPGP